MTEPHDHTYPSRDDGVIVDWTEYASLSVAVAEAIADATGRDVDEIPPLYDSIESDALERLFETVLDDTTVSFAHAGARVVVSGTGTVVVDPNYGEFRRRSIANVE